MPKKKVEKDLEASESNEPMTREEIATAQTRKKTKQAAVDRALKKSKEERQE